MTAVLKSSRILAPVIIGLALCAARPAQADDNRKRISAEALFDQGTRLMTAGRYAEACEKFEASQALDAGIGTLLYLGDCYERRGKTASAWATFREAESLARAGNQNQRAHIAATRARALERKLSRLAIVLPPEHAQRGLRVSVDGQPVLPATFGEYLPIDPGEHRVVVSAPGRARFERTIKIAAQQPDRYRMVVPLLPPAPEQSPSRDTDSGSGLRTAGLVTAGAGVLSIGAGAVLGVLASEKNDESLAHCPNEPDRCTPEGVALRQEAREYADWSTAGFAAGGGLLITGAVLYIAAPDRRAEEKPRAAKLTELRVAPTIEVRKLGLTVKGRF